MADQSLDRKAAFDYCWAWFSLHADQRMRLVNFWLIAASFITAGMVQAYAAHLGRVAGGIALAGGFVTFSFHQLELRTRGLVTIGENALMHFEDQMAEAFSIPDLRLKAAAEQRTPHMLRYRSAIRLLHWGAGFGFVVGAIYGLFFAT